MPGDCHSLALDPLVVMVLCALSPIGWGPLPMLAH
jgi:hypothetical protein